MATDGTALEVEASDVVRVVLQFLKENGLAGSLAALQDESGVSLNATDNVEALVGDVLAGHWDLVLGTVGSMRLPQPLLSDLYEQVVLELLELRELDTARQLLRSAPPLAALRKQSERRFARLESLASRPYFEPKEAYQDGSSREHRRAHLADSVRTEVQQVPPARLLSLLGQALKWQQHSGQLPTGARFDLLAGGASARVAETETFVTTPGPVIKFGKKCHAECAAFSPDGQFFISGSMDGFLEVLALAFSRDSELLASGSQDGALKVWRPRTGQCIRRFPGAHGQGITCISFTRDGMLIATGSFDHLVRVHGIKSGKALKEMRGHNSYVNAVDFSPDASRLASASSDGTVRVWDARSSECLHEFRPPQPAGAELAVNSVCFMPGSPDQLVVCNRSNTVYITTLAGSLVKALCSGKALGGDFVSCVVSPAGGWVHAVAEDAHIYSFDVEKGELAHLLKAHDKEAIGIAIHPHRNLVATWGDDSTLRLWRAGSA